MRRFLLLITWIWGIHHAWGAPGDLDTSFGSMGTVATDLGTGAEFGRSMALQSDGKIVVAGESSNVTGYDFAVVRYHPDGSLDTGFGTGGKVITPIGIGYDFARAVALQSDGKIVVAGHFEGAAFNRDLALVRYLPNGALDPAFGSQGKVLVTGPRSDYATTVALQKDGKILVAGYTDNPVSGLNDFLVMRFHPNGNPDAGFGNGGRVTNAITDASAHAESLVVQNDGKIVVAGSSFASGASSFVVARYLANGTLDSGFGASGKTVTSIGSDDHGRSAALQSDGKIVVAGDALVAGKSEFAIVRYQANGALDSGFGTAGKVTTNLGSGPDVGRGVVIRPDEKIVVAGAADNGSNSDIAVVLYHANGSLDTAFGAGGKVTTAIGSQEAAYGVAIQDTGRIVVAGYAFKGSGYDFAAVRYEGLATSTVHQTEDLEAVLFGVARLPGKAEVYHNDGFDITAESFLIVGETGLGVLNQTGGTFQASTLSLGHAADSAGFWHQSGGAVTVAESSFIGAATVGVYDQAGGTYYSAYDMMLGDSAGATGTFRQHGGTLTVGRNLYVGQNGSGTVEHTTGTVTATNMWLGQATGAAGSYALAGVGTLKTGHSCIGNSGLGTFLHTAGLHEAQSLELGGSSTGSGSYLLADQAVLTVAGSTHIGTSGIGNFTQTGGTHTAGVLRLGVFNGKGNYEMAGGELTAATYIHLGYDDSGVLRQTGGTVTVGTLQLGTFLGGVGTYHAEGGTITAVTLKVGAHGTGKLNINGGTLNTGILLSSSGEGSVIFSKGAVTATSMDLFLGANGLVIGDGINPAMLNLGSGTHAVTGTGAHVRTAATLALANSQAAAMPIALEGGTLTGSGTLGALTVTLPNSVIAPGGEGVGILATGNVMLNFNMPLRMDLIGGASDRLEVTGTVNLANAALVLTLRSAPPASQQFILVQNDGTDAVIGAFTGRPEGSIITLTNTGAGGGSYRAVLSYQGGTGNDVTLTIIDPPSVLVSAATGITANGATLEGSVNPQGRATTANFEYGPDTNYGGTAAVTLAPNNGNSAQPVSATITGLTPSTIYYYRLTATNAGGAAHSEYGTFTSGPPSTDAALSGLSLCAAALSPNFDASVLAYAAPVPFVVRSLTVTPILAEPHASVAVNGVPVTPGAASGAIPLSEGGNVISITVTAQDGATTRIYTVTVTRAAPLAGDPDFSLNSTGQAAFVSGEGNSVRVQADGKILVAGSAHNITRSEIAVVRYQANGSPDLTFGSGGRVTTAVGTGETYGHSMALQNDGKIVVAGYSFSGNQTRVALVRYHPNGSLDTTFGTGGKVATAWSQGQAAGAESVAIQSNGKIVVAGYVVIGETYDIALLRYNANGTLDTTFGSGGRVATAIGAAHDYAYGVAVQGDGKIVAAGFFDSSAGTTDLALVRYNANGSLDSSFGVGGKVTTAIGAGDDVAFDMALQSDEKILLAGCSNSASGGKHDFAVVRYHPNGALDDGFGSGGVVTTAFGTQHDQGSALVVQSDGRIAVAGYSHNGVQHDFALVRYEADGTLDSSFGNGGKVTTALGTSGARGQSVAVLGDGRLVVAGSYDDGSPDFAVVRYHGGGPRLPKIAVHSAAGTVIADGGSAGFGSVGQGARKTLSFAIINTGAADLTGLTASIDGADGAMLSIAVQPPAVVPPGQSAAFSLTYAPASFGSHSAAVHLASNDASASPFDINLTGSGIARPTPQVKTLAATEVLYESGTLHGTVDPLGSPQQMAFEYGLTPSFGTFIPATPGVVDGFGSVAAQAVVTVQPHRKYHYRLRASGNQGVTKSPTMTFTTPNRAPIGESDYQEVVPGGTLTLDVLTNDTDADGDALSLVSTSAIPAAQGKLIKVNDRLVFTAASTFTDVGFTYRLKDHFGGTAEALVLLVARTAWIDLPAVNLPSAGGSYQVTVTATAAWSVNKAPAWTVVDPISKTGNGLVQITVQPNAAKAPREAVIEIAGQSHKIRQAGVSAPSITMPATIPAAIVSGDYELPIPTVNGPVTYTATNLPPGLTLNQAGGAIIGKPSKAGDYPVVIKARNAAGAAPASQSFTIGVAALQDKLIGSYHGYIPGDPDVNGEMGSRIELTTTKTGAVTGKLITGTGSRSFAGKLDTNAAAQGVAHFTTAAPLNLALILDAATDRLTGAASALPVAGWRQVWKAGTHPATAYKGLHTFFLTPPDAGPDLPQGHGFGSFTVDEKTGALKVTGKLADDNTFLTSTFIGPTGEVLIYQPLYKNQGSFGGALKVAADHFISGAVSWYKPAAAAASGDVLYREGFGPAVFSTFGGAYASPPAGGVVMGLPNTAGNARLEFTFGGLDVETKEFGITFDLLNPRATGLTNKAVFPSGNPNMVTMPAVNLATGGIGGKFTLLGARNRIATWQGQLVEDATGMRGYGFFLLSEPAVPPATPATAPRNSGRVILKQAAAP